MVWFSHFFYCNIKKMKSKNSKNIPKKTIKSMFKAILVNWQFPNNTIKQLVKQV